MPSSRSVAIVSTISSLVFSVPPIFPSLTWREAQGASVPGSHKGHRHSLSLLSAADVDLAWPQLSQLGLVQWLTYPFTSLAVTHHSSHSFSTTLSLSVRMAASDGDVAFRCLQPSLQRCCALICLPSDRSSSILARLLLERHLLFGTLLCLLSAPALLR